MTSDRPSGASAEARDSFQTPGWTFDFIAPRILASYDDCGDVPTVWDCACGKGNLVKAAMDMGFKAFGTDIANGDAQDFLRYLPSRDFDCLVTNPPYSLQIEFLERAFSLFKPFAFLLPLSSLETASRQRIFKENPVEIVFLDKRVNFDGPDGKISRARFATAWFTSWLSIGRELNFP